jgi:hypothetical protein
VTGLSNNEEYHITAWARSSDPNNDDLQAELYVHDGNENNHESITAEPTDDEVWQLLLVTFRATATGKVKIHLAANFNDGATGTIYWDNVTIAKVDTTGNDERTYYPNTTDWILNKVAQGTVYSGIQAKDDDSEGKVAQTRYHYDMNGSVPRDWDDPPTKGLLTQEDH